MADKATFVSGVGFIDDNICRCPTCGHNLDRPVDIKAMSAALGMGRIERLIFEKLASRFGQWVSGEALADAAYRDDPDGGPLNAEKSIAVMLSNLRGRLKPFGFAIEWHGGHSGDRRLWYAASAGKP